MLFSLALGCSSGSSDSPAPDGGSNKGPMDASHPLPGDGGPDASDAAPEEDSSVSEDGSSTTCDCDDGIECTLDTCDDGVCAHLPRAVLCGAFEFCSLDAGCVEGPACASQDDCERPDVCTTTTCDPQQRKCRYAVLDGDQDSDPPLVCGGGDCNDDDALIHSQRVEACNLVDDDCDGNTDPLKGSGCATDRSCVAGSCTCDAPTLACGGASAQCVDVTVDEAHCGGCKHACLSGQSCDDGECHCDDGEDVCDGSCVDLDTDELHCGDCDTTCDEGAECAGGGCQCASAMTDCLDGNGLECRNLASDASNCGECGAWCLSGSKCESSSCEATVTWAKLYGAPGSTEVLYNHHFPLARGPNGEVYAILEMNAGDHRQVPSGGAALWTSARGIAKFDNEGNFVWHVASTASIGSIAFAGGALWAVGHSTANVTVGSTTFTVAAGSSSVTWLMQLDPSNGNVLASRKLDYEGRIAPVPELVVDGEGELWLLHTAQLGFTEGLTTWLPADTDHASYLLRLSDNTLRWLPGGQPRHKVDPSGNIVIAMGTQPYFEDFTFGGDTLNNLARAHYAVVRFTPDLTHLNSFLIPSTGGTFAVSSAGALILGTYEEPFIQRYAYSGISGTLDLQLGEDVPLAVRSSVTAGGRVFISGRALAGAYDGRPLSGNHAFVAAYDEDTLALESFAAFNPYTGNYASVTGLAVDATGTEVTLSVAFSDRLTLGAVTIDSVDSSVGLALIRLHMP